MATHQNVVSRFVSGPLQGAALTSYFVLLPYVVVTKWDQAAHERNGGLVRVLLVVLAVFWVAFLIQLGRNIWHLHRGTGPGDGASAWLAGLLVTVLAFLIPSSNAHAPRPTPAVALSVVQPVGAVTALASRGHSTPPSPHAPATAMFGSLPLALMAKRRSDLLRQHQYSNINRPLDDEEDDVDEVVELLRGRDPELINALRDLIGGRVDGVIDVDDTLTGRSGVTSLDPVIACALGPSSTGTLVAFAREGGRLAVPATWSSRAVVEAVVALSDSRLIFADNAVDLLRSLATRTIRNTLVVYLGPSFDLDEELAACSITLTTYLSPDAIRRPHTDVRRGDLDDVRVNLLRADPQVNGLSEPFTPTLRRRCVEMVAYLALHRHEPVTGDRLRTRVLTNAEVDASSRTLANTASAVRRSVGADDDGPRLHSVTSSGLYVTHGITSDVEIFTTLVARARELPTDRAAALAHQALTLIKGEPLASALRGFEWFLAEGHAGRLARDGEWAALVVHHDALGRDAYEVAYWALRQGLCIDPYSETLLEASARVPRLREFGGDRRRRTQDQTIGAAGAVAMSWSFQGLGHQISE